jgi:hypothetical protein
VVAESSTAPVLALAGGRMGLRDSMLSNETVAWPFIPLPAVLVIAAGVVASVGVFLAASPFAGRCCTGRIAGLGAQPASHNSCNFSPRGRPPA